MSTSAVCHEEYHTPRSSRGLTTGSRFTNKFDIAGIRDTGPHLSTRKEDENPQLFQNIQIQFTMKTYFICISANRKNEVLYTGVTDNLIRRIYEHKHKIKCKFSAKYNVNKLIYYETHFNAMTAIHREKRLKEWKRVWKIKLIEKSNPLWED